MSAMLTLLERARVTGVEKSRVSVSKSGTLGLVAMVARPNGSGGAAQVDTHARGILYIAIIKRELDNDLPLVRGPAADVREERA